MYNLTKTHRREPSGTPETSICTKKVPAGIPPMPFSPKRSFREAPKPSFAPKRCQRKFRYRLSNPNGASGKPQAPKFNQNPQKGE